ncbi:MAG: Antibiotic biosynthesis monooxygenase [Firmicutes bacterium]|nr:Antibiotic biosynthesis monooxygenase [Bacillota bacterium]
MLVVIAKLMVKPEKKAELFSLAQPLIAATRAEQGCISYTLLDDRNDPNACFFLEEWIDKAALEQHLNTAHICEWHKKSADLLAGKMDLKLFQAEAVKL